MANVCCEVERFYVLTTQSSPNIIYQQDTGKILDIFCFYSTNTETGLALIGFKCYITVDRFL